MFDPTLPGGSHEVWDESWGDKDVGSKGLVWVSWVIVPEEEKMQEASLEERSSVGHALRDREKEKEKRRKHEEEEEKVL